ncbi:2-hydroxyacid dehydrogenase [Variovorax sp. J22G73]|uniref:2-hydroxyacid dehydrogenase n=1 Tax=unclassified Variovorax TaxID=663243 RepID=UPI0025779738|nr:MULTISPECIES: 2-hydroxyacid dehydrogenase [unclassified Variovorax]MDM0008221.1 2-hydroxyacid dehydrogenase [Variovorax sp. J22R203]MDM0100727.1 2-hydroxyacid dehydrogenase [Variovorax sp. J22G73]
MHIQIVGLHAPHAPRLRALLGPGHEVEALQAFPEAGAIAADVVIANSVSDSEAARLRCRLLQVPGAGSEEIAMQSLPAGTTVCNVHGHEVPIAEFVLHAILEHSLRLWQYPQTLDADAWAQAYAQRAPHDEAHGKTVAILGFGHIGQEIARRARACGMHVIAVTRSGRQAPALAEPLAHEFVAVSALDEVLPRAQVLVVCCPLDDSTRGLIGARQLALLPTQALLVNVARAEVVDEPALYEALRDGRLGRAVLDVWYRYPKKGQPPVAPSRWPLHALPNVRATPHISAITPALLERRYRFMADNIARLRQGEPLRNVIHTAR